MRYIGLLAWMVALSLMADMTWIWYLVAAAPLAGAAVAIYNMYQENRQIQRDIYEHDVNRRLPKYDNLYYDGEFAYYDETEDYIPFQRYTSVIFKDAQGVFIRKMGFYQVLSDWVEKNRGAKIHKPYKNKQAKIQ